MRSAQQPVSQADLHELIYEAAQATYPRPPDAPTTNKWWLSSGLQKSVRRGNTELAQQYALGLLEHHPGYVWRRLPIIALEDIGPGSWLKCALTLEAARSSYFRRKVGEKVVLLSTVAGLAKATKSRSLCDQCAFGPDRIPAAEWSRIIDELGAPWLVKFCALRGKSLEGLALSIPTVQKLIAETEIVASPPDPFGDELIKGLPAAAIDMHVREGLQAYRYLAKCPPFREFFERVGIDPVKNLGLVVFYEEGDHLNRELVSDSLGRLEEKSRAFCYSDAKWSDFRNQADIDECERLVAENREALNHARRRVLS